MFEVDQPESGLRDVCRTCGGAGRVKIFIVHPDARDDRKAEAYSAAPAQACPTCGGTGHS